MPFKVLLESEVVTKNLEWQHLNSENTYLLSLVLKARLLQDKNLDIEEITKRLRRELKGVDVEAIARKIEAESNERARREYKILRD